MQAKLLNFIAFVKHGPAYPQPQHQRYLAIGVGNSSRSLDSGRMTGTPSLHLPEDGFERPPVIGEGVLNAWGNLAEILPRNDTR